MRTPAQGKTGAWRLWLPRGLMAVGMVLVLASLGQYGWMEWQQARLRQEWRQAAATAPERFPDLERNLIRLEIPSIHLDDIVAPGTRYGDLLVGPGWMKGTPAPGNSGNSVIAGHRDTFFREVEKVGVGAVIVVRRQERVYTFRVTRREIVWPTETSLLESGKSRELTLVTCYPTYWVGPAPKRLIVQARLQSVRPSVGP